MSDMNDGEEDSIRERFAEIHELMNDDLRKYAELSVYIKAIMRSELHRFVLQNLYQQAFVRGMMSATQRRIDEDDRWWRGEDDGQ